jgi:hypothetical protein
MKLSKALLAAMLTGITLQTVQSCTKGKDDPPKEKKEDDKGKIKKDSTKFPFLCPACGMG